VIGYIVSLLVAGLAGLAMVMRSGAGTTWLDKANLALFVAAGWVWLAGVTLGYRWSRSYDVGTAIVVASCVIAFWVRSIIWLREARCRQAAFERQLRDAGLLEGPPEP
jgi:threonine/homoserine efflux transporter RhtA